MISGITANSDDISSGGGSSTTAVHFNGNSALKLNSISCTDNGYCAWSGWFKTAWFPESGFPYIWVVDPNDDFRPAFFRNGTTQYEWEVGNATYDFGPTIGVADSLSFLNDNVWQHIICACDMNQSAGNKRLKIYVNDVDATGNFSDATAAWSFVMNGKEFWLGDDSYFDNYTGDIADFSFWPGVNLLTAGDISEVTRRLFIDGSGNLVAPTTAIASLGTPALMLTGNAASFATNSLGSNGSLSVPDGYDPITNASSSPYD